MQSPIKNSFAALVLFLLLAANAGAECKDNIINPIGDIDWMGIFPVSIGGFQLIGSDIPTKPDPIKSPVCVCKTDTGTTFGLAVSFWEPARLADTVKDPYCFTAIGVQLDNPSPGFLSGDVNSAGTNEVASTFQQTHWMIFPIWAMLDLFLDMPCLEKSPFDIAYMTEIDPTWNSDILSMFLNPEALLFSNPVAALASIPDAIASNAQYPLDPIFWQMGSWGSAYPLDGTMTDSDYTQSNAALAARMIFKLGREELLWDTGLNVCGAVPTPIWVKSNYRLQIAKPVRGAEPFVIGTSGFQWGSAKNPPGGVGGNSSDNFEWVMFRRNLCCIGYTF